MRLRKLNLLYIIAIVAADVFVYMVLGLLLMGYDDSYDATKGEYGSFASMAASEKIIYGLFCLWQLVNAAAIVFFIYKFSRKFVKNM